MLRPCEKVLTREQNYPTQIYFGDWTNRTELEQSFETTLDPAIEILFASYCYRDYSGTAFVLYRQDGKLYEVNGDHCSCYGLEGQWQPEETTLISLQYRLKNSWSKYPEDWRHDGVDTLDMLEKALRYLEGH